MQKHLFALFSILGLVFLLSGCNGLGTAKFDEAALKTDVSTDSESENGVDSSLVFAGISSADGTTDSTVTLHWTTHALASAYDVFKIVAGSPVYVTTVTPPSDQITLTSLTPGGSYYFRVRMKTSAGLYDTNTNDVLVALNAAPDVPSGISLVSPVVSPHYDSTPTIKIAGVKAGDTVKLYKNSNCTDLVQTGTVDPGQTTIDLTTPELSIGHYDFYATSTGITQASVCSTATLAYEVLCPAGYVAVSADINLGTSGFCVMKWEAKCATTLAGTTICAASTGAAAADKIAVSTAQGIPWSTVTGVQAATACQNLNTLNGVSNKYDLISNAEWMAVARSIESNSDNWFNIGGVWKLSRGHSDGNPAFPPCDGTVSNVQGSCSTLGADLEQKRTHLLANGETIWDFSGNLYERVDWTVETPINTYTTGPSCLGGQIQAIITSCSPNLGDPLPLVSKIASPLDTTLTSANNIGTVQAGATGGVVRSGRYDTGAAAGIYNLRLDNDPNAGYSYVGFRCVYRY